MIEKLMNFNHFTYKKPFSGSDKGNRFKYIIQMIEREIKPEIVNGEENGNAEANKEEKAEIQKIKVFQVTCWSGEKNSKETPDEEKKIRDFAFTEEGYDELLTWLREESDKIAE